MATTERAGPYFIVLKAESSEPDIAFHTQRSDVPADLLNLKADIEKTLSALRLIYSTAQLRGKLDAAFAKLLGLAQVGLGTSLPAPSVAKAALDSLHSEIVDAEAGAVKNRYLLKLGRWAAAFLGVAVIARTIIEILPPAGPFAYITQNANFLVLFAGCMAGAWLSFGARRTTLGFFDLIKLEDDQLEPGLRLVFVGLLTTFLGLMIVQGWFDLTIGAFEASRLLASGETAFLLGGVAGLAEKALPSALLQRASAFIQSTAAKI